MDLPNEDFKNLRNLVYEKSGLFFDDKKIYFFKKRVENRILSHGFSDSKSYYMYLRYGHDPNEINILINLLTTNETYFFREISHLNAFSDEVLPRIIRDKRKSKSSTISVWCAGCSSGDEPYTLAMIIHEKLKEIKGFNLSIVGSDINTQILEQARVGFYTPRAVKDVPKQYLSKYFIHKDGGYHVKKEIKNMVTLRRVNLSSDFQMRRFKNIDVIFCRNVLIYFDELSRKKVINCFFDSLTKGGFIFLGQSESVGRISAAFQLVRMKNSLLYMK